jgi:hypothetical protein
VTVAGADGVGSDTAGAAVDGADASDPEFELELEEGVAVDDTATETGACFLAACLRPGSARVEFTPVTRACCGETEMEEASDPPDVGVDAVRGVEPDLVAMPMPNAAANGTIAAAPSRTQRLRGLVASGATPVCGAAVTSTVLPLGRN